MASEVRAIFTPRYRPMDNFEVLERLDRLGYAPETRVQCCLDTEFLSLSIPDGSKTFAIDGDRITPGISISNSRWDWRRSASPLSICGWYAPTA